MDTEIYKSALTDIIDMECDDLKAKLKKEPLLAREIEGFSPLIIQAVYFEERGCVKVLLEKGADPNAVNNTREMISPIHMASLLGSAPLINILLEAGADHKRINAEGLTPLDYLLETLIAHAVADKMAGVIYDSDLPVNTNDYRAGFRFVGYLLEYQLLNSVIKFKTETLPLYGALANKLYCDSLHMLGDHYDKFEKLIKPETQEIFQMDFGTPVRLGDEVEPDFLDDILKNRLRDGPSPEPIAKIIFDNEVKKIAACYQKNITARKKADVAKETVISLVHNALNEYQELYATLIDAGWRSSDIDRQFERADALGVGQMVKYHRVSGSGLKRPDEAFNENSLSANEINDRLASDLIGSSRAMEADEALRINLVESREMRPLKDVLKELDQQLIGLDSRLSLFFNPGLSSAKIRKLVGSEPVHPDLIALYSWHNGFSGQAGQNNPLFGEYRFLPLTEALALREQMRPLIPAGVLPVMLNEEGDWMDMSVSGEGPYKDLFCIADHDDLPSFYPTVASYFAALIACLREGTFSIQEKTEDNGNDLFVGQLDKYFAINDRYILSRCENNAGSREEDSESQHDPDYCVTPLPKRRGQ